MPKYILVTTPQEFTAAADLFTAYAAWLAVDLGFQHFDEEVQQLQKVYAADAGGIILCKQNNAYIGCVAVRKITGDIAELKRMYVLPSYQQQGIGQQLLNQAAALAVNRGYTFIRLDTLQHMTPAINLYTKNGFYPIAAYYHNPIATALYFEKKLVENIAVQ